ncbi:MAG: YjjG family noncanonical pyrimidine nucleotidase [Lachnospiraceae bacterium]|nr:YjjG family noncanonical pyrimidine nucleotidase [Lachnospiraceae bacterium]
MKGTRKITTILWDVDNTLLDFGYSMRNSLEQCFRSVGKTLTLEMVEGYARINDSWWKRLERGEVTKAQLLNGRFTDFFAEYGLDGIDVEAFREEYQRNLGNIYSYLDDSLTICKALQTKYRQYVVTNGVAKTQRSKLGLAGFADVMADMFISEEVGYNKPSREFFEYCLSQIDERDRSKILIVGDSLTSDIHGGNSVGIKTCWYNPGEKPLQDGFEVDFEICDLHQIYDILEIFKK